MGHFSLGERGSGVYWVLQDERLLSGCGLNTAEVRVIVHLQSYFTAWLVTLSTPTVYGHGTLLTFKVVGHQGGGGGGGGAF